MAIRNLQPPEPNDLGFGTNSTTNNQRLVNRDGQSNVLKTGLPFFRPYDAYLKLITMGWGHFLLLVFTGYLIANFVFATIYVLLGRHSLMGASSASFWSEFQDAFFFSSQTISTLGFSRISPAGFASSSVAAVEALIGLLAFALATGLLYGRFSRPVAKILYSEWALISPYREMKGLMFRIANMRRSELIDADVTMTLSRNELQGGKMLRRFYPLSLERKLVPILSMTWTVVHPIDEESPFHGLSLEELRNSDMEVVILIKAFDDTFSQTVHSRFSYKFSELVYNAKFVPVTHPDKEGRTVVDLSRISEYQIVDETDKSRLRGDRTVPEILARKTRDNGTDSKRLLGKDEQVQNDPDYSRP